MPLIIPERLMATCRGDLERQAWLEQLPSVIQGLAEKWSLRIDEPFSGNEGSCAWVAPALLDDGRQAVFKAGMPHMEAEHEIQGLRFWNGNATARLLEADENLNAMLLERCDPGTTLRQLPEPEQDVVVAQLLRRLWRKPLEPHPFRPLSTMTAQWASETIAQRSQWPDAGLVREGLRLFEELSRPSVDDVLLATDLHAGNILAAQREPWLVIDPKPFIGDRTYDATQHLYNCEERVRADPDGTIKRFADQLEVDQERVRLWVFARAAAESRYIWDEDSMALARMLS